MDKKLNIMVSVSQEVYDAVVVPHKQSKSFSNLVGTLIDGYYKNQYIRGYADDTLEGVQKEADNLLNSILGNMREGLANMGVFTEELHSTAQDGMDAFSKRADEARSSVEANADTGVVGEPSDLRGIVEELKNQNTQILELLKSITSGGVQVKSEVGAGSVKAAEKVEEAPKKVADEIPAEKEDANVDIVADVNPEAVQQLATSYEEANSILAGLLDGNMFGDI